MVWTRTETDSANAKTKNEPSARRAYRSSHSLKMPDHAQVQLILPDGKVNEPALKDFVDSTGLASWGLDYQVSFV